MTRLIQSFAVAAPLMLASTVMADWVDNFDSGTADQSWFFGDEVGNPAALPAASNSASASTFNVDVDGVGNYLHLTDNDATPGDPLFIAGFVSESFTDVRVSGLINVDNPGGNNDLGLLARGNVAIGNAYLLSLDLVTGNLDISKSVGGAVDNFGTQGNITVDPTQSYYLVFAVNGSTTVNLTGRLYDAVGGNLLATASATDSVDVYTSGDSGVVVAVNEQAGAGATPITGTFDQVQSIVPEPASAILLGMGTLAMLYRRQS